MQVVTGRRGGTLKAGSTGVALGLAPGVAVG
jgi:hypothetical protein